MEDIFGHAITFCHPKGVGNLMKTCKLLYKVCYNSEIWDKFTFGFGISCEDYNSSKDWHEWATYYKAFHEEHKLNPYCVYKICFSLINNLRYEGSFVELINKKTLNFADDKIKAIPKEIVKLTKLDILILTENSIKIIPEEIFQLTQLTWLSLACNNIRIIPKEIGKLVNLEYFCLDKNKITSVAGIFKNLTKLKILDISNNKIKILPKTITKLINLRELFLNGNTFKTLPKGLELLENLHTLQIESESDTSDEDSIDYLD